MSNGVTKLCRSLKLTPSQKAVLMCLADYCHDDGLDWHSIAAIMTWTCLGKTAVIDSLKQLEAAGLIERLHQLNGQRSSTILKLDAIAAMSSAHENQSASRTGPSGEPVRVANPTSPPGEPEPVRVADQPVRLADPKHQEASVKHQRSTNARAGLPSDHHFPVFWSAYPRKVAQPDALKAFKRHQVDEALLQKMLSALERQARSLGWSKETQRFIPYPATWLNQKRWEDDSGGEPAADDETQPAWALRAGFPNRYEAENAGCFEHNASRFSQGHRSAHPGAALSREGTTT